MTAITKEQAEAIAKAPWSYASADITAALLWAIKEAADQKARADALANALRSAELCVVELCEGQDPANECHEVARQVRATLVVHGAQG